MILYSPRVTIGVILKTWKWMTRLASHVLSPDQREPDQGANKAHRHKAERGKLPPGPGERMSGGARYFSAARSLRGSRPGATHTHPAKPSANAAQDNDQHTDCGRSVVRVRTHCGVGAAAAERPALSARVIAIERDQREECGTQCEGSEQRGEYRSHCQSPPEASGECHRGAR
jgi:hypothetical protein